MGQSQGNLSKPYEAKEGQPSYIVEFNSTVYKETTCRQVYEGKLSDSKGQPVQNVRVVVKLSSKPETADGSVLSVEEREVEEEHRVDKDRRDECTAVVQANELAQSLAVEFCRQPLVRQYRRSIDFVQPRIASLTSSEAFYLFYYLPVGAVEAMSSRVGQCIVIEPFIEGSFDKFNSNRGWECPTAHFLNAFSHWTFEQSGGALLVCDLQGNEAPNGYRLTDAAVHTLDDRFRKHTLSNDCGVVGMEWFFRGHRCNDVCRKLGLQVQSVPSSPDDQHAALINDIMFRFELSPEQRRQNDRRQSAFLIAENINKVDPPPSAAA